eukprot:TRINITY_DN6253_c1_g1_i3.p1 TRINITY_DN6253_c1_g1~~TRINITY_DN6253_c1_g1_i3.p1  ORF type:complete len:107 (-),score=24.82 TRINITY_DN6253_c1_g1_i3:85-378(-)
MRALARTMSQSAEAEYTNGMLEADELSKKGEYTAALARYEQVRLRIGAEQREQLWHVHTDKPPPVFKYFIKYFINIFRWGHSLANSTIALQIFCLCL